MQADSVVSSITNAALSSSGDAVNGDDANISPGNSAKEVCETPHPSLRGVSRSPSAVFRGGRDVAVALSDTCIIIMDNGDDRRQRCHPAKERAVELAEAIHRDDSKGKREKKERGGSRLASVTTTTPPALRSDDRTILDCVAWARALLLPRQWRR